MNSLDINSYGILAHILDALAGGTANKVDLVSFLRTDGHPADRGQTRLMEQLVNGSELPLNMLDPLTLLESLSLDKILGADGPTHLPGMLGEIFSAGSNPGDIANRLGNLFRGKTSALLPELGGFLKNQASIALSLVTSVNYVKDSDLPKALTANIKQYFFSKDGYRTVDENYIKPPMQVAGRLTDVKDLKSLTSAKTAEHYIRDIVRINGETMGDFVYTLPIRYSKMRDVVGEQCAEAGKSDKEIDQTIATAKRWFTGYSNHAEAAVMGAVEEALLGASSFQLNPLIAAAAGMAAGTAARKATQHVFLRELRV